MRDDLFAVPVRKYHVDNNDDFIQYCDEIWKANRFEVPDPFIYPINQLGLELSQTYTDLIEAFLTDIGCYETHNCTTDSMILKVLSKGEATDRIDTLPSHYTLIHYVDVEDGAASDTFHHPARSLLNAFRPAMLDEWREAAALYINKGDVIIYPSFMEHSSPVNMGTGNRVTLTLPLILQIDEQSRESNTEEPTS